MNDLSSMSYIQSTLRNVGVFTTISIGFLRAAFVYSKKNNIHNHIYLLLSLIFLSISICINYLLMNFVKGQIKSNKNTKQDINIYLWITQCLMIVLLFILFFGLYRLYQKLK